MVVGERTPVPRIQTRYLKRGATLSLTIYDDTCLRVIYGEGGGCVLGVAGGAAGVWIPLRDSLQVRSVELNQPVHTGEVLVTEHNHHIRAVGHANGRWLAVVGGDLLWKWLLTDVWTPPGTPLFPALYKADRELKRAAISVARAKLPLDLEGAVHALTERTARLQASLHEAITRCPGRTWSNRCRAFLRLQRVRNYIDAHCNLDLDNDTLALMANYSPCSFIRAFTAVYLETPHSYLIRKRLLCAKKLLHSSNLAIAEVAHASGFDNPCVFSRTFHKYYGMTATETRGNAVTRFVSV